MAVVRKARKAGALFFKGREPSHRTLKTLGLTFFIFVRGWKRKSERGTCWREKIGR